MAELFKFRCFQCAKLLGVSPRKAGRVVHCPRCGIELIVPAPDDPLVAADQTETEEPDEFTDLGIDLGFGSALDIRPPDRSPAQVAAARPPNEVEALDFLGKIAESGLEEPPPPPAAETTTEPTADDLGDDPAPLVATAAEPLVKPARTGPARAAAVDRRRDVVLPRTAVIAWSLFALLALALSFVAGLMVGHYRWR